MGGNHDRGAGEELRLLGERQPLRPDDLESFAMEEGDDLVFVRDTARACRGAGDVQPTARLLRRATHELLA